jgi:hypothetical protein
MVGTDNPMSNANKISSFFIVVSSLSLETDTMFQAE